MSLQYKKKNVWQQVDQKGHDDIMAMGDRYKVFLNESKTERESVKAILKRGKEKGFIRLEEALKRGPLNPGDKVMIPYREKAVIMMVVGEEDMEEGLRLVGSHIDAPRLDLKQNPLYEDGALGLLKTHYYGGVKKYQWTCIPLSLHGVIFRENGEKLEFSLGDDPEDPVFYINDLLIHLSGDQMKKSLAEGVSGEELNVVIGHSAFGQEEDTKDPVKENILQLLKDKYNIREEDFLVAEIEAVPAEKARDVGLDRAMISGHGHDDRVCAYASLEAILQVERPKRTSVALFVDKEEIGSYGNTGMTSRFFENILAEVLAKSHQDWALALRRCLNNSQILSADVTVGYDPSFPQVSEKQNTAMVGYGATISKYTGSRGKGGCNDANSEFLAKVRDIFNGAGIIWQTAEMGKVDQGGGGTIAAMLAEYGAEVVDCGIPTLSMHAPMELISKADLYMTAKAYEAFFKDEK